ncbi:AAA family ATPase [Oerskovia rustica]|uniref:AAA family ATPase n=1 Tax=Oerskovia rustica TaxID=2762237 RepID=A0ABR8RUC8_9CELL|nr:AAA family ATPase [Oerskovia rustica]MBD7951373.1 AAA family ATPase [Oerskovia rustica]
MSTTPGRLHGAPRPPHLELVRERLVDRLDADAALRVVRGPSGGGKTSLLAEWARRRGAEGVWIATSPGTTRTELWRTVARRATQSGLLRSETTIGLDELSTAALTVRLAEAFLTVRGEVLVVVDDYQNVRDAEVHEDVLALLRACPNLSVALATTTSSMLEAPVVGLEMNRTVITADQLPLTLDETARMLRHVGADLDPAQTHVSTGGQPLYLRVAMLAAELAGSHGTPAHVQVAAELLRAAVDKQLQGPSRHRLELFLARCVVPEILTGDLAVALTLDPDAPELLSDLEARGLGTWERRPTGLVFVLFPVVRSLLLETFRLEDPEASQVVEAATARWYLQHGYPVEAVRHAVTAGDLSIASAAVSRYWTQVFEERTIASLDVLRAVPVAELRPWPLLAGALARHYDAVPGGRDEAIELYHAALAGLRVAPRPATPSERVVLEVLESLALRSTGSAERALYPARRAGRMLNELRVTERRSMARDLPRLRAEIARSMLRGGAENESLAILEDLGDSLGEPPALHGLALRALAHAVHGNMPEARRDLAVVEASRHDETTPRRSQDVYHLAHALVRIERFDARGAQAHLDAMRPFLSTLESRPQFALAQASVDLLTFEPALGAERLRRYIESERGRQRISVRDTDQLGYAAGLLDLARGRLGAVHATLRGASPSSASAPLLRAHLALLTESWQVARDVLVEHTPPVDASPRLRVAHSLLLAAALVNGSDESHACDALGKFAAVADDRQLLFALTLPPRRELLALVDLAARSKDRTAQRVLAAAGPVPERFAAMVGFPQALTDREIVVLDSLRRHATAVEISLSLTVSVNTVKSQLRSVYRKLGVRRREDALAKGIDLGLIVADHVDPSSARHERW